jgi:hypothetical protein
MPSLPALIAIALIGLFVAACNEEPQSSEAEPPEQSAPLKKKDESVVDPAAPRMLEPTKPGGSGNSKG